MDYTLVISTCAGLEEVLMKEIKMIGGREVQQHTRAVSCTGDLGFIYKANFSLRTALSVMVAIGDFRFRSDREFYAGIKAIDWSVYIHPEQSISVRCKMSSDAFSNALYPVLKAKEALVDYFHELGGKSPNVNQQNAEAEVLLIINERSCTVQMNSSGASLHQRGYKAASVNAPVSEVLAAGLILLTGWEGPRPLVDCMCGSGIVPVEAALIAARIPPGVFRDQFAFERWPKFDEELFSLIRKKQMGRIKETPVKIYGIEPVIQLAALARQLVELAGVEDIVQILEMDYREFNPPLNGEVVVACPSYGDRFELDNFREYYKELGELFKKNYAGYSAWIFTTTPEAQKWLGLRPSRNLPIVNGDAPCSFLKYEMY